MYRGRYKRASKSKISEPEVKLARVYQGVPGTYLKYDKEEFWFTHFVDENGDTKRLLAIHGNHQGMWDSVSSKIASLFEDIDVIECCHPQQMYRITGDKRIKDIHNPTTVLISVETYASSDALKSAREKGIPEKYTTHDSAIIKCERSQ